MSYDNQNIFAKIISGEIPCDKIYESEFTIVFEDIRPQAPSHVLIIPWNNQNMRWSLRSDILKYNCEFTFIDFITWYFTTYNLCKNILIIITHYFLIPVLPSLLDNSS